MCPCSAWRCSTCWRSSRSPSRGGSSTRSAWRSGACSRSTSSSSPPLYTFTLADTAQLVRAARLPRHRRRRERAREPVAPARRGSRGGSAALRELTEERERLAGEALEAEALRRSDALKTALLRAVSHDLRSPLMAILTSAGALAQRRALRSTPSRPRASSLETILGEADRLDRVVEQPARPLAARRPARPSPEPGDWPVDDLVAAGARRLEAEAAGSRSCSPDDDSPARPCRRRTRSSASLANLVENALRYSPAGEPRARAGAARPAPRCSSASSTTGPGIPSGEPTRIFEPFQRGSLASRRRGAGPRARDRARLRRGERRPRLGRVASGAGRDLRARAPGRARRQREVPA